MENYNQHKVYRNTYGDIIQESYLLNGRMHRIDGPAHISYFDSGNIERVFYYVNGKFSRENAPSYISYYYSGNISCEQYALNDKLHRTDGPQFIEYDEDGHVQYKQYYIFNRRITEEQFNTPGFVDAFILENS